MISIQELGLSIMSDSPKHFYIIGGNEYGVKEKYIQTLTNHYGSKEEYPNISSVIDFLSVKHLVPVPPSLYVVRYDDTFVSGINEKLAHKIRSLKIKGTVLCLYNDAKQIAKLDKFLPDSTCIIEAVNPKFIEKYLHSDFPKLDDRSIKIATRCCTNYGHARNICNLMQYADPSLLASMSEGAVSRLFGCDDSSNEGDIQRAVANRNFVQAIRLLENYEGNFDNLVYTVLQTMIELEKAKTSKYPVAEWKDYTKFWKLEDIFNMFMNTYDELDKLRSNTSTDVKSSLIYLFGLFTFQDVPSVEVMNSGL